MAKPLLSVEIQGLEELRRKLDGDRLLGKPVREAMEETLDLIEAEAKKGASPHPADRQLAASIKSSLAPDPIPLSGRVFTRHPAEPIEEGTRPGRFPPVAEIEKWVRSHGISVDAWIIARQIRQRGTKGLFFMKRAREVAQKKMPAIWKDAAKAIERDWGRR